MQLLSVVKLESQNVVTVNNHGNKVMQVICMSIKGFYLQTHGFILCRKDILTPIAPKLTQTCRTKEVPVAKANHCCHPRVAWTNYTKERDQGASSSIPAAKANPGSHHRCQAKFHPCHPRVAWRNF